MRGFTLRRQMQVSSKVALVKQMLSIQVKEWILLAIIQLLTTAWTQRLAIVYSSILIYNCSGCFVDGDSRF